MYSTKLMTVLNKASTSFSRVYLKNTSSDQRRPYLGKEFHAKEHCVHLCVDPSGADADEIRLAVKMKRLSEQDQFSKGF